MQEYYKLNVEEYLNAALPKMQKAIDTVASNFSGTSFPTENLFVGMECYRTDEKKIYRLTSDNPATWQLIWDLSLEAGQAVKDGNGNNIAGTYATKTSLESLDSTALKKNGEYVKDLNVKDGKATVTKGDGSEDKFDTALNILQRNKAYAVGDIAYSASLPSYNYLECITAGTTGEEEPDFSEVKTGGVVVDGTVEFTVKDMRQNEKDISEVNKEIKSAKTDIASAEEKIEDLYSFADSVEIQRDLLAGVDLSKTTDVTDIGASNKVTLAHPYTDYDYLEFVGYDSDRWLFIDRIEVSKIKRLFEEALGTKEKGWIKYIFLKNDSQYIIVWDVNNCTDTMWEHVKANGKTLVSIYGVKTKNGRKT